MLDLIHNLPLHIAGKTPHQGALAHQRARLDYGTLAAQVLDCASGLLRLGLGRSERVAVYLEKRPETVIALFGAAAAGGVFVPVNPLLKPDQVAYILRDCNVRILVTSVERLGLLASVLNECHDLHAVIVVGGKAEPVGGLDIVAWGEALTGPSRARPHRVIDTDMAAILYTSGSTGKPKGVVLSHRNMVAGARSVAQYLENHEGDRILSALPLSFDAGFSQLTTAFHVGASVTLINYLLPRDIITAVERERITGLTAVPPLWIQLAQIEWPEAARNSLRYIANTGGRMPKATLDALRAALPKTLAFLMYGLTESFRSTYLPPSELDRRPDSIGKAIPNAEVLVVREDGTPCAPGEPGELVHRGALVSLGYWNPPRRDDQDLGLSREPHRSRGGDLRDRAGRRGRGPRHSASGARAGDRCGRNGARRRAARYRRATRAMPTTAARVHGASARDGARGDPAAQSERQDRPQADGAGNARLIRGGP